MSRANPAPALTSAEPAQAIAAVAGLSAGYDETIPVVDDEATFAKSRWFCFVQFAHDQATKKR